MTTPMFAVCLFDDNNRCEILAHVAARDTVDAAQKAIPLVVAKDFREAVRVNRGLICGRPYAELSTADCPLVAVVIHADHAAIYKQTALRTATYML